MPRIDRLKEELGWLTVLFTVAVALDASLIAWVAQKHGTASLGWLVAGLLAAVLFSVIILFVVRRVYTCLEELGDL